MIIRTATPHDVDSITSLFYQTINAINNRHYNAEQVAAWSAGANNKQNWLSKINEQHFFVALDGKQVVGFSSVTASGYLDYMFVHHLFQGKGIAKQLLETIENVASASNMAELITHASITARPFFEKHGFSIVKEQTVMVRLVELTNFVMRKAIDVTSGPRKELKE